jgi:hypothetical protein
VLVQQLHRFGGRDGPSAEESAKQHAETVEVIEVSMGDIDDAQVAVMQHNPVRGRLGLGDGGQGVHQHGVVLAVNQRRSDRIPTERLAERPGPLTDDRLGWCGKNVDTQLFGRRGLPRGHDAPFRSADGRSPSMAMIRSANR